MAIRGTKLMAVPTPASTPSVSIRTNQTGSTGPSSTWIRRLSNEKGRMIVAVRDSRLGLSPEVASRITYRSA